MKSKGLTKLKNQIFDEAIRWEKAAKLNELWDDGSRGKPNSLVHPPEICKVRAETYRSVLRMIEEIERKR